MGARIVVAICSILQILGFVVIAFVHIPTGWYGTLTQLFVAATGLAGMLKLGFVKTDMILHVGGGVVGAVTLVVFVGLAAGLQ